MSTEIKNTLFRFATMRAPQLIEDDKIEKFFVKHPESEKQPSDTYTSAFLSAANAVSTTPKKERLQDTAISFETQSIKSVKEIKTQLISESFYDFTVWLSKNKSKITAKSITKQLNSYDILNRVSSPVTITNETTIQKIWENIFYQSITNKSSYVRDLLLSILTANHFLRNYQSLIASEENLKKLAQTKVVIPNILFEKETASNSENDTQRIAASTTALSTSALNKEMQVLIAKENIEEYKNTVTQLKKEQKKYLKAENKAYELAKKEYEATVQALYANAETIEKTILDPVTNQPKTITTYVDLEIPQFSYEKQPELVIPDSSSLRTDSSLNTKNYLVQELIQNEELETFDEVIASFEERIAAETNFIFENTSLSETLINTNGVVLATANDIDTSKTFTIGSSNISTSDSSLTLLFNNNFDLKTVSSANYKITFNDNSTLTQNMFISSIENNKLFIRIFQSGLQVAGKSGFHIKGEFVLSNNDKIIWEGNGQIKRKISLTRKYYYLEGNGGYTLEKFQIENNQTTKTDYIPSAFGIKRLGILDYRKVEQEICCYVPGEVSHIENVMAREYKERSTRRLRRSENTTTSTKEKETEHLTDSSTTDRFEMNQEVSSVLTEDTHFGAFVNVTAEFKPVTINAGADYANNTSSEESNHQAVTHAKEVTEKVLDRVVQKIKEERISKIIEEFEENNKHGYDNRDGGKHISGVYRWIDKVYKNKVVNYGKRLMYEFMIPQPAAFHTLITTNHKNTTGEKIEKPVDPRTGNLALKLDDNFNTRYKHWVQLFGAEVEPCPKQKISVSKGFEGNKDKTGYFTTGQDTIKIPDGYEVNNASASASFDFHPTGVEASGISINIGSKFFNQQGHRHFNIENIPFKDLGGIQKELAVAYKAFDCGTFSMTVVAECELTAQAIEQWQLETYNAIIKAYETKLSEYNSKMVEIKAMQGEKLRTNPLFYREIENTVLRKNCLEYLSSHEIIGGTSLIDYGKVTPPNGADVKVKYDSPELDIYAARVKFLEQAFEWSLLSYNLYPFYWAEKNKWADLYNINDIDDATHKAFLQSGMARVMVTVRPGFEEAVNWYMATGQVWNGGQVPTVDDPLFLSIVDELRVTTGEIEETWETRVPTSLTIIQAGEIGLEVDKALPCCEDRGDNPFGFREQKTNLIEFSFIDMDGGSGFGTIGDLPFPRIYKCQGQTITINRDAKWHNTTNRIVIFEKLAQQLSLINGIDAKVSISESGETDGITFTVDKNIIKDFSFIKPGGDQEGLDGLHIHIEEKSIQIKFSGYDNYLNRILDKNKKEIQGNEANTLLPISRFLV